ncbi:peptidoglycan-binding domain-containing protein [Hypericibacter sp.]|uniref:peptidoglycan-binding domain-containing protein n=1 Tax=Hypericibacter sp. TaxID=2705401 RepID=UPI003D6D66D2
MPEALRRQQLAARHAAEIGNPPPRTTPEAVPLSSVESDPLAEAARHFRELQAKSAGVTEIHMPPRPSGDVARDLLKDDGQLSSLALSENSPGLQKPESTLPVDMLIDNESAAARVTPRTKLWAVTKADRIIDVEAQPLAQTTGSPTFVDMDPDLSLPLGASPELVPPETPTTSLASFTIDARPAIESEPAAPDEEKTDGMKRALALAAAAPILTTAEAPAETPSETLAATAAGPAKLPPFPTVDRARRAPAGPSGNLRLFAGLSVVILAFAGSLVWVAMWRADTFIGGTEATLEVSPEDLVQTAAGGDAATASADGTGTATATLMVRDTELLLAKLALDPGPADGVLDQSTRDAIRRYQQMAGLPETGEPSKELLDELKAVVAAIAGN